MGRSNISEVGRRFSSEYQPANRGRKKGSRNRRTILRDYLRDECDTPSQVIEQFIIAAFGKPRARRMRKQTEANVAHYFRRMKTDRNAESFLMI